MQTEKTNEEIHRLAILTDKILQSNAKDIQLSADDIQSAQAALDHLDQDYCILSK